MAANSDESGTPASGAAEGASPGLVPRRGRLYVRNGDGEWFGEAEAQGAGYEVEAFPVKGDGASGKGEERDADRNPRMVVWSW